MASAAALVTACLLLVNIFGSSVTGISLPNSEDHEQSLDPQLQLQPFADENFTVTVDFERDLQQIDGFGFCQTFGRAFVMNGSEGLPVHKQREVLDLLLSPQTGAGFSILRLGVFGIQPNDPGGPDAPPQYSWDRDDGRQLWLAKEAQRYGVDRFFADPWSAPGYMKTNGDVNNGGVLCGLPATNCSEDWRQAYADYLIQYIRFYSQEGIHIQDLGFTNEPDYTATYDSMRFTPEQANDFIKVMGPTIARSGLKLNLVCCDSFGWTQQIGYTRAIEADPQAAQWVQIHTGHSYASQSNSPLPTDRPMWMSEYALDAGEYFNPYWDDGAVNSGLALANHIHDTLALAGVNAYITWFGASVQNTAAPIQLAGADYQISKRLWATAAYSRFIRPRAHRVHVDGSDELLKVSAYRNAQGSGSRVINLINNRESGVTVNLILHGVYSGDWLAVYRTDEEHSLEIVSMSELQGPNVVVELPRRSLITLVIDWRD